MEIGIDKTSDEEWKVITSSYQSYEEWNGGKGGWEEGIKKRSVER